MDCEDIWNCVINFIDIDSYSTILSINKFIKYCIELKCQQHLMNKKINNYLYHFETWTNSYIAHHKVQSICQKYSINCFSVAVKTCSIIIKIIPPELTLLDNLVSILFVHADIFLIPKNIINMTNLQELVLQNNLFVKFPKILCDLPKLKILSLRYNQITKISKNISRMNNLNQLMLDNNKIHNLPKQLFTLTNLNLLSIHGNNLSVIDDDIYHLTNLNVLYVCIQKHSRLLHISDKLFPQQIYIC